MHQIALQVAHRRYNTILSLSLPHLPCITTGINVNPAALHTQSQE